MQVLERSKFFQKPLGKYESGGAKLHCNKFIENFTIGENQFLK
jgi:hypothetical protein